MRIRTAHSPAISRVTPPTDFGVLNRAVLDRGVAASGAETEGPSGAPGTLREAAQTLVLKTNTSSSGPAALLLRVSAQTM